MRPVADLADGVRDADYVVEAVLGESAAQAEAVRGDRDSTCGRDTILASNTSVIPITDDHEGPASSASARSARIGGIRRILVPLVEVIGTQWTSPQAIDFTMKLHADAGKKPAHVKKDVPGFIGNRLQHALWREAISLVERGICDAETVDTVIKAAFGRRLAVLGPLENADLVGTDLTLAIHKTVLPDIDSRPGPSPYLRSWCATASSASSRAKASANGPPSSRPRCAPRLCST